MPLTAAAPEASIAAIAAVVQRYWGFSELRPLQHEAIQAELKRQDSLVVLPTGGGKSLCYQVPPALAGRMDVVVSPLISLMKDQVDGLLSCGYPAAAIHSLLTAQERQEVLQGIVQGRYRLLFVSPERLVSSGFLELLARCQVRAFAIDEAHCISHWGHDFRPEYRQLALLKQRFAGASIHAYTATATPRVRQDIVAQLGLEQPTVLVGCFDRPNLCFRILPRYDLRKQVREILARHAGEAAIVYCITRDDTETLADNLRQAGIRAEAYHAGLEPLERRRVQEAFAAERLDVVVATVAFGMGIDRSNVRCVIHAAMPKSVEHYQQEAGRAGRDGLEAECVLLYSAADVFRWRSILKHGAGPGAGAEATAAQLELLGQIQGLCTTLECRHSALSRHFGQGYAAPSCQACDVCLEETRPMAESTVVAQKILSCIARLGQRYGVSYVAEVLKGTDSEAVRARGDRRLSTYGLLKELPQKTIINLIYQLIDQGLLTRTADDRPIIQLCPAAGLVLRGEQQVRLLEPRPAPERRRRQQAAGPVVGEVNAGLFETLRDLRRQVAAARGVPAYIIFSDATLRALAAERPRSLPALAQVHGIGEKKLADLGGLVLETIARYCADHHLPEITS